MDQTDPTKTFVVHRKRNNKNDGAPNHPPKSNFFRNYDKTEKKLFIGIIII